jgi:hypothetical protein
MQADLKPDDFFISRIELNTLFKEIDLQITDPLLETQLNAGFGGRRYGFVNDSRYT